MVTRRGLMSGLVGLAGLLALPAPVVPAVMIVSGPFAGVPARFLRMSPPHHVVVELSGEGGFRIAAVVDRRSNLLRLS